MNNNKNFQLFWGLGIGDWGLGIGIGDWAQSPIPNPHNFILKIPMYFKNIKLVKLI